MIKQLTDVLKSACIQVEMENNQTYNNVDKPLTIIKTEIVIYYVVN